MSQTFHRFLILALLIALPACTRNANQELVTGPSVPAARGTYSVSQTDNGNTRIQVKVSHLAEPSKLAATATTYLVWAQPEESTAAVPLGALKLDKDLTGSIEVMTPQKTFQLFITAEMAAGVSTPTGEKLLWASIGKAAK